MGCAVALAAVSVTRGGTVLYHPSRRPRSESKNRIVAVLQQCEMIYHRPKFSHCYGRFALRQISAGDCDDDSRQAGKAALTPTLGMRA